MRFLFVFLILRRADRPVSKDENDFFSRLLERDQVKHALRLDRMGGLRLTVRSPAFAERPVARRAMARRAKLRLRAGRRNQLRIAIAFWGMIIFP